MEFVKGFLTDCRIKKKARINALLVVEEVLGSLIEHRKGDEVHVKARALLGTVTIELSNKGEEFSLTENMKSAELPKDGGMDDGTQDVIRNILLRSMTDDLQYRHKDGVNFVRVTLVRSKHAFLFETLGAMLAAIVVGLILSWIAPESFNSALSANLLTPIKTMYLNALKIVVAPVVFFSIISCIVQFSDLSDLGRIGGKTLGLYICTTLIAVGVGVGAYYLFKPGSANMAGLAADASSITSKTMNVSIKDMIVGIVPSNFLSPFLESNMLQLIFLAVICGIAAGLIGKYSSMLKDLFQACNDLFLKITTLIIRVMPIAVFCSISSMILTMGSSTLLTILGIFGTFLFGLVCMMAVYCLMMPALARLDPLPFLRKYAPVMLQVFSMASSNASIPVNMEACEKKLGISRRVFSLSIPLGATLNMDGTCIHLAVFALALAKVYGVPIGGGMLTSMIVSIIVLSMGAPGIPGSGLICLSVLLTQMNVPVEAIGLVMGIDALIGMFRCMSNCLGDVAVTAIVAKSEGRMDMEIYRR
ncbi:MAG: dicarboxylate/amino acid:cation symporter [Oscillospiraceae bacterium]|nr:dicarboxylate/amino acid:cation symporter [Oscillospiraceae bacterium]MBR7190264.1 dicarboxylate/amino acid:cation symporter [Oscillospiraceae bacterium]